MSEMGSRLQALTFSPETEQRFRDEYAGAVLDVPAFHRRLGQCTLATCEGMCCYDGVYVDVSTAGNLRRMAAERTAGFAALGVALPPDPVGLAQWKNDPVGLKTAVRPHPYRSRVAGYPSHFNETSCVFRADDGRCTLQAMAMREGRHPWFYKPITCWLHPIDVSAERITIYDETTDPCRFPDYDGYVPRTFCGRTDPSGQPAYEVLRSELEFLGRILGRDLLGAFSPEADAAP